MATTTARWLNLARVGYLISLILLPLWSLVLGADNGYSLGFKVALLIPLLLPAVGLIKGKAYTHAWSGFIASLYLLWAATSWWVNPDERLIASVVLASLLLWLFASTYYARHRGRELGLGLKKKSSKT
ncbi:DUF2069 domain-containing protein [Ferrimonas balearica]|uniref:DUF2069 domain-containing protein n=1 Tax=Ferrimonas balearica TaxID=44012 RepID=UPI001C990DDC|nr:DUF2069 domain-containing protein [Ferrimonas balearica]MBY5990940.1 DUF2069 domain-containing protein [Ferrimonas balearica]